MRYEYNADGIRTLKNRIYHVEGASYIDYYTVDGTKILSEKRMNNNVVLRTLYYIYDASGSAIGMEYNGAKYWYDKNLQGDIVGIRNSTGTPVAKYVYDAWGKNLQVTDEARATTRPPTHRTTSPTSTRSDTGAITTT